MLRYFHHRVARQIADRQARLVKGKWEWPPIEEALEIAGLLPIEHYIRHRQDTILQKIINRPIHAVCQEASSCVEKKESQSHHWWTQPLQDAAEGEADALAQPPAQNDPSAHVAPLDLTDLIGGG